MSAQNATASYIASAEQLSAQSYLAAAMFTLFIYDYLLNFEREVELIWKEPFRPATYLYLITWYPQFGYQILQFVLNYTYTSPTTCTALLRFADFCDDFTNIGIAIIQSARTYSLWNQNQYILCILVVISLPVFIPDLWTDGVVTCNPNVPESIYIREIISAIGGVVASTLIIILTVVQTFRVSKISKQLKIFERGSLYSLLLHDGSMYYICIFLPNLLDVFLFFIVPSQPNLQGFGAIIGAPIASTLMCRFLLNLRETSAHNKNGNVHLEHITSLAIATEHFQSVLQEDFGDAVYRVAASKTDIITDPGPESSSNAGGAMQAGSTAGSFHDQLEDDSEQGDMFEVSAHYPPTQA